MLRFIRDLVLGEPALALGLVATALGSWLAVLVAGGGAVPLWLAVATPVASAVAAVYTRQVSVPSAKLPELDHTHEDETGAHEALGVPDENT